MYGAIFLRQSRALERMQLYATKPLVRSVVAVIWAIFTLGILAAVVFRYLLGRRIGHGAMMAFGFSFYCTLPFAVYGLQLFDGGPGNEFWVREFEAAYKKSPIMLFWFLVGVLAFYCGTWMPALKIGSSLNRPLKRHVLIFSLIVLFAAWIFFVFQARNELFSGYGQEYRPDLMGPLATVNLLATMFLLNMRQYAIRGRKFKFISALVVVNCALLLSMGGRMYVMFSLTCLIVQYINEHARKPFLRFKVMLIVFLAVLGLAMVGVWRLGLDFDWNLVLITALAEPILTSISMGSYMSCGEIAPFLMPLNYLGSIINFVPSVFIPDKMDMLPSLDPQGNCLDSPFGATHIISALLGNFGVLGSLVFIFFFAWFLKTLLYVSRRGWWFYYYACGLLPFIFFRDGFLIFNKAMFGSGLIVAVILIGASRIRWEFSASGKITRHHCIP